MISQKGEQEAAKGQREEFQKKFQDAIEKKEFLIYLLPKFHMGTEEIFGAEVLVRWQHPQKGLLLPLDFLPQCVKYGRMHELDLYVWEEACRLLALWQEKGLSPCTFSVKISESSLYHTDSVEELTTLLEKYQIKKEYFQLEIEEDSIRADIYQAKEAVNHLHESGFTILLDDFSYGCSSISALNQIDVDILKVDMKFFSSCNGTGKGEAILASIIKCVNWLGMSVLAECVETKEQNDFVKIRGCDYVQGFYFSKPIPVGQFEEVYLQNKEKQTNGTKPAALSSKNSPKNNLTILVVDDEEMERVLLRKYLQGDFHVHLSESAEDGLEYLRDHRNQVDLILVDYIMPKMNGIDFLRFCQLDPILKGIPKIMITSNERARDQILAFEAGAYDYLLKPLLPELVHVRVRHALELNHKIMTIQQEKQEYQHQAEIDKATGVLNKTAFQAHVEKYLASSVKEENALLMIDIDNFKNINDTQGHLMGDKIIQLIASELSSSFRSSDYVGRFGGDEFTVFMMHVHDREMVEKKAEAVLGHIKKRSVQEYGFEVTVSIGIGYSNARDQFQDLFARTDEALYRAKEAGKGTYRI